jgi:probable phosphoglycerate mutase
MEIRMNGGEEGGAMNSTKLYLVRHGQTEWNVESRIQGHLDSPLTEYGVKQAVWVGEALREVDFDIIYAGSSGRTVRTAEIIREYSMNAAAPIMKNDNLREKYNGSWEGQLQEHLNEQYPKEHHAYWHAPHLYRPASGESFYDVQNRAVAEIERIIAAHPGETLLIVTHTITLKLIMAHFEGRELEHIWNPPFLHPACLCMVELRDRQPVIHLNGDISHFKE